MKKFFKNNKTIILMNLLLLIYIIVISFLNFNLQILNLKIHNFFILSIMFTLELLSTFTFQKRMKLTAIYTTNSTIKLKYTICVIASISWLIAALQGLFLLSSNENILTFLIKLPVVLVATFSGVWYNLKDA